METESGDADLEELILGGEPLYSPEDVARLVGMPLPELQRFWRSFGFAEVDPGTLAFTDTDALALGLVRASLDTGLVDLDGLVSLVRGMGQSMSRLADWDVAANNRRLNAEVVAGAEGEEAAAQRVAAARRMILELGPAFEELLVYSWRRHLAAAIARSNPALTGASDPDSPHVTVGFADLVQFTALSNEIGESRIGDLVEIFESRCHDVVAGAGGRVIKSLGDSVLFVAPDPDRAVEIAEGIVRVIGRDERMPDVRIGMASGPVTMRLGDVFGPAVNMAARLTSVARRNRVIIDQATADLLPDDGFDLRRLPARPLRGFGDVEPIAVRRV